MILMPGMFRGLSMQVFRWVMMVAVFSLAGCASGLVARVTSYQQWPPNTDGATYAIKSARPSANSLQFSSVSEQVSQAMDATTGLVQAVQPDQARFDVMVDYGQRPHRVYEERDVDPFWGGWGVSPYFGGFYGSHWGWHSGIVMSPMRVSVPVEYIRHTLSVTIRDRTADHAEVYQGTAVITTDGDDFVVVLPYLAQAVFDDFPGNNGQVREVRFEPDSD